MTDIIGSSPAGSAARPIESASASTAVQTNSSKFAYIITAAVLGVVSLFVLAIILLVFTGISTSLAYYDESPSYTFEHGYGYDDGYGHDWGDWDDYGELHRWQDRMGAIDG